jgi:hypothetical protein
MNNEKGCSRFSTFIFMILPNLAKYTYGWSPVGQHHKIEKTNLNARVRWESGLVPMFCDVRHATSCWLTDSSCSCCCSTVGSAKNPWLSCVFRVSHLMGIRRRRLSPAQPWPPIVAQFSTSLNNFSSQKQFSFSWFGATWCFLLLDTLDFACCRSRELESEREIVCVCACACVRACVWRRGLCAYLFWWIESAQFVCWGEGLSVEIAESLGPGDEVVIGFGEEE